MLLHEFQKGRGRVWGEGSTSPGGTVVARHAGIAVPRALSLNLANGSRWGRRQAPPICPNGGIGQLACRP